MTGGAGRRISTATLTGTALLLALGVVLPLVFHAFPLGGRVFLPMHIPTFTAGLLLGPASGLIVGAGSPVLSALITGRPPVFYMVPMIFELATYGLVAGLARPRFAAMLRRRWRAGGHLEATGGPAESAAPTAGAAPTKHRDSARIETMSVVLALVCAMVAGRIVWLAVVVWLAPVIGIEARTVVMAVGAVAAGWIGMAIQLVLIPAIVRAIERLRNP